MIPEETIREVRERVTILEVVSDYVSLKKSGANYLGLCPFHGEKTPSFNVNPAREIFHCFGCGVGGNAFSFIMRMEGLAFPEAIKFLARRVGVVIEERPLTQDDRQRIDEREQLYRISDMACRFYNTMLVSGEEGGVARRYLEGRGVATETIEKYRLGYAPDKWDSLCRYMERMKISLDLVEKLGLVRRRETGGFYDIFRNRLLFTIADIQGRPIAFGGRVLDDSLPKYINSPESAIYRKSEVLFGLDLARQAIREKGSAIIVEGYFDQLALFQAGVREVAATCGTALTADHIKLLKRYAGKLYMLFDSDSAGRKATVRAMDMILTEGVPAAVVELPAGDDPDSFVGREGAQAFSERLEKAEPIFEHYFKTLLQETDTKSVEGKSRILEELAPKLKMIGDRIQRRLYVGEVARMLGVDEVELRNKAGLTGRRPSSVPTVHSSGTTGFGTAEMLIALVGKYPELAARAGERGVAALLPPHLVALAEEMIAESLSKGSVDWPSLLSRVVSPEAQAGITALFVNDAHLEEIDPAKAFEQCCVSLERGGLKDIKQLARELACVETDSSRYIELLEQIETLRNRKSQLL